jgi:hypothetical protein
MKFTISSNERGTESKPIDAAYNHTRNRIDYEATDADVIKEFVAYEEGVEPHIVYSDTAPWEDEHWRVMLVRGEINHEGYEPGSYDSILESHQGTPHQRHLYDDTMACGEFLNLAEQIGMDENEVLSEIVQYDWCFEATQEVENRTKEERYEEILRRKVEKGFSDYLESIYENGNQGEVAHDLDAKMNPPESCACYSVATWVADRQTDAEYVEGFATTRYGGFRRHAWVEIDGKVMDYTWDWTGVVPPENCVYVGYKPDFGRVLECHDHGIRPPVSRFELDDVQDTLNVGGL